MNIQIHTHVCMCIHTREAYIQHEQEYTQTDTHMFIHTYKHAHTHEQIGQYVPYI